MENKKICVGSRKINIKENILNKKELTKKELDDYMLKECSTFCEE